MTLGQLIFAHHTEVSIVFGPALLFILLRWVPISPWASLGIATAVIFFGLGMLGILYNSWLLVGVGLWAASRGRRGLKFLRVLTLLSSVVLFVAALAFYGYVLFTNPGDFWRNWFNPISVVYFVPSIVLFTLSAGFDTKLKQLDEAASAVRPG